MGLDNRCTSCGKCTGFFCRAGKKGGVQEKVTMAQKKLTRGRAKVNLVVDGSKKSEKLFANILPWSCTLFDARVYYKHVEEMEWPNYGPIG